ncbi:MAG TPA: Hsp20/alpha crystallin family protein [Chitinophagaceae bacterium]|nr:Hsp20/alpha crystallin family protein [Chitinophagaceae bacterium]
MESKDVSRRESNRPSLFNQGWMDRFFNSPIDEFFNMGRIINMPAVNISENENEFHITLAAPGLEKSDFKVECDDDMLTISAEKEKEERNGKYNRREYNYSSWSRSFSLPDGCDSSKIDAEYKNGELHIHIPRTQMDEAKKAKQINIR